MDREEGLSTSQSWKALTHSPKDAQSLRAGVIFTYLSQDMNRALPATSSLPHPLLLPIILFSIIPHYFLHLPRSCIQNISFLLRLFLLFNLSLYRQPISATFFLSPSDPKCAIKFPVCFRIRVTFCPHCQTWVRTILLFTSLLSSLY